MQAQIPIDMLVTQLEKLRKEHGEPAYEAARKAIIFQVIDAKNGVDFIKNAWPELDIETLRVEAAAHKAKHGGGADSTGALHDMMAAALAQKPKTDGLLDDQKAAPVKPESNPMIDAAMHQAFGDAPPEQLMFQAMRAMMPGLKTQGQLNIFMMAFDALKDTMNGAFDGNDALMTRGKLAIDKSIEAAVKSVEFTEKLKEIPEDQRSPEAAAFVDEAKELHEYDIHKTLMRELESIDALSALNEWYDGRRARLDRVVTQGLRNTLFDAIRVKRNVLEAKEAN